MKKSQGKAIAKKIRDEGFTLIGWARNRGLNYRTFRAVLFEDVGEKRGGEETGKVFAALHEAGYLPSRRDGSDRRSGDRRQGERRASESAVG